MNKLTLKITALILLFISLFIFWKYYPFQSKSRKIDLEVLRDEPLSDELPFFHADSVIEVKWQVKDKEPIHIIRSSRDSIWKPYAQANRVDDLLNKLSNLDYKLDNKVDSSLIQFSIVFSNQSQWDGSWDGENIYWKSGNLQDKSVNIKNTKLNLIFYSGQLVFHDLNYSWCSSPLKEILIQSNETHEIKGFDLQNWASKYCEIIVDDFIDRNIYFGLKLKVEKNIKITYLNNEFQNIVLYNNKLFKLTNNKNEDIYFFSNELLDAFN